MIRWSVAGYNYWKCNYYVYYTCWNEAHHISFGFINYQTFPLTLSTTWYLLLSLLHWRNKNVFKKVMRSFHFLLPCVFNHYGQVEMACKECAVAVGKLVWHLQNLEPISRATQRWCTITQSGPWFSWAPLQPRLPSWFPSWSSPGTHRSIIPKLEDHGVIQAWSWVPPNKTDSISDFSPV